MLASPTFFNSANQNDYRWGRLHRVEFAHPMGAPFALPSVGGAVGGRYVFAGGTPRERMEVVRALDASTFDWQLVPARITIHIERGTPSRATPGEIWLDADLLDAGSFAWGVIQHEYAHQVDFFLLTSAARTLLRAELGGGTWCDQGAGPSPNLGCERFASTLAWAGIPSVVFGPGDIARAHTCDEWVLLEEVEQAAEILYRLSSG